MPDYKDLDDFHQRFVIPVVSSAYKNLKSGGHFVINTNIGLYDSLKSVLGPCTKKTLLRIVSRKQQQRKDGTGYKEYIYVWNKD
jgi:hypothetical protein